MRVCLVSIDPVPRACRPLATSVPSWNFHQTTAMAIGFGRDRRSATDPELKGRWTDPPAGKWPFFGVLE